MKIGVPKEIKAHESRVAVTPAVAASFRGRGHEVVIQSGAGEGSGFTDAQYEEAGARIAASASEAWACDMVMKVKEPLPEEYVFFRPNLILYTYLHLAPNPELTEALVKHEVFSVAYETIQLDNGSLPLLTPMSEVAGRMSIQIGARFLENANGGRGLLLGGVPGVEPAKVTVVGGGIVGVNAAKMALGLGAEVTVLDINPDRLRQLDDQFQGRLKTLMSNPHNIAGAVQRADVVVGAVLIPGARAPRLVTEAMVKSMKPRSVIIDVAIDQGGSIETIDRFTTHDDPTYVKHGVVHYAVANIPGAVARTSTEALSNVTAPYGLELASKGAAQAALNNRALARGVNTAGGKVTYRAVAEAHGLAYTPLESALQDRAIVS